MNQQLQDYARAEIKRGLSKLPEKCELMFKRMYSHEDLTKDINVVVDEMPEDKLNWAMEQVQNSIDKCNRLIAEGSKP